MCALLSNIDDDPVYFTISYAFSGEDGEMLGSSMESGLYTFCAGAGDCIPGLESRVHDMKEGEQRSFIIPAAEAYGSYNPELARTLPASAFPESLELKEGLQITVNNKPVTVVELRGDEVTIDANHPLAGVDLHFTVRMESVGSEPPSEYGKGCCGGGGGEGGSCGCGGHGKDKPAEEHGEKKECKCGGTCGCGGHGEKSK